MEDPMIYNEIYCHPDSADEIEMALHKLSLEHPEWNLSFGQWDSVEVDDVD